MTEGVKGYIHSIQSMGTLDGPGVRYVLFMQGCPLRCKCCHNPDTWSRDCDKTYDSAVLSQQALRYREYFGSDGGVTVSGGEPLLQPQFVYDFFARSKENGLNTCLDTSGCVLNEEVKKMLSVTDRVMLDIKYTSDELYLENVGCSLQKPLEFLDYLASKNIPTTIRQVIIPTLNDNEQNINALVSMVKGKSNVDKIELLPFRKICQVKYDKMDIPFPFAHIPQPTKEQMEHLESLIKL